MINTKKLKKVLIIKEVSSKTGNLEPYLDFTRRLRNFLLGKVKIGFLEKAEKISDALEKEKKKTAAIIFVSQAMLIKAAIAGEKLPRLKFIIFGGATEEEVVQKNNLFILKKDSDTALASALKIINS